jgi:glyoxylase-like metal-dependent hydrolase (beta-lactamase superfamily II)
MIEIIPVTGCAAAECYLLVSENRGFLVDTGYAFCADITVRNIAQALGARPLTYILLTHSHYDHADGLCAIRRAWPEAVVVASRHAKEVFLRPGARSVMRALDDGAAAKSGEAAAREDFTAELTVDRVVKEGDVLSAGDISISVMEAPGHTKCCLNYCFNEDDLLVLSETTGIKIITGGVFPTFIVSYRDSLDAIARAEGLAPRRILISHSGPESGNGVAEYFKDARAAAEEVAEWVLGEHGLGKGMDEIMRDYTAKFYTNRIDKYQPAKAFMLNAEAMIPRLIRECGKGL